MGKEIEYKFLVDKSLWKQQEKATPKQISQCYLHSSKELTTRIRIKNNQAFITIKGATVGVTRSEFEYEIPLQDAREMMEQFGGKTLHKLRYEIQIGDHLWEVDEFQGKLSGLILAEIELSSENETFERPNWITEDVSRDPNYYNAILIERC